jgi:hypothetical protein
MGMQRPNNYAQLFRKWLRGHRVAVALTLILTLGACLRVVSFIGLGYQGDDVEYAQLAHRILAGGFLRAHQETAPIYPVRIGILAPAAAAFKLFGVSEWALGVFPLLISLVSIFLAYLAGRMFFSERVGIVAALLQALLPIDVRYGTLLYPDPPGALFLNVAILLAYLGSRQSLPRRRAVAGALAGLCLGLSWLCKEAVLFSVPFVAGYLLWLIYRERGHVVLAAWMAVGFAGVVGTESGLYAWYVSDPLYHFHAIERHSRNPWATPWFWPADATWGQLGARLFRDGPETILLSTRFGLVTAVGALAVCYALFKGWRSYAFVGAWFVYHGLVFNFGSHSLRSYMPLPTSDRYLWPLLLPALLLTAAFVDAVLKGRAKGERWRGDDRVFWAGTLVVVLTLGFAHGIYRNFKEESVFGVEKALSRMLSPESPVFSDGITLAGLRFFWAYPQGTRLVEFGGMRTTEIPNGAYVLVNPKRAAVRVQQGWKPPEFFYEEAPRTWIRTWESSSARLYRVPD